jgi:hypothetical protein
MDDGTYGGYVARHARPPAFTGSDGVAYSAAALVDEEPDAAGRFGGAFLFVRWAPAGDLPTGHVETDYLVFGASRAETERLLGELPLLRVKAELDRAIATRVARPHW